MERGERFSASRGVGIESSPPETASWLADFSELRLVYLNARSLRSNRKRLSFDFEIIRQFNFPEIIVVTETWLDDSLPNSLFTCHPSYNMYRFDRPQRTGGGVMVLVKNCIRSYVVTVPNAAELECLLVAIVIRKQKLFIGSVYKPNVADTHLLQPLRDFVKFLSEKNGKHLIVGDFNLPHVDWIHLTAPAAGKQDKFMRIFTKRGYRQVVKEPTRENVLLDLVFTDDHSLISETSVLPPFSTSDHSIVSLRLNFGFKMPENFSIKWFQGSYTEICDCLGAHDWYNVFSQCTNVNAMYEVFTRTCHELINMFVPYRRNGPGIPHCRAVRTAVKRKHRCHKIHKKLNSQQSLLNLKAATENLEKEIYKESLELERSLLTSNNPRKFYSFVNSKLKNADRGVQIVENGEPVAESTAAELFNRQFLSVFIDDNGIPGDLLDRTFTSHLCDVEFTDRLIQSCINQMERKTSCGIDGLPPLFFKECSQFLIEPLKLIFQRSFEDSEIPLSWKIAEIVPIFKKGSRNDVANYRPVSLTCVPCRLMESVLKRQLVEHLRRNNLISDYQHGFMSSRSTASNLLSCLNDWFGAVNARSGMDIFYIDISKAFDTVSHTKLIFKLKKYGISGKFLSWIEAFLGNRSQRVKLGEVFSGFSNVRSGVPQGSVLGPILFLIYINDLSEVLQHSRISIFADDTKIYFKANDAFDFATLQSDIDNIMRWCSEWQLDVAAHKCNIMHIGPRGAGVHTYGMGDSEISTVSEIKDLGVTIDSDLRFSHHITNITTQAFQRINLIFRSFISRDKKTLLKAYVTYVRPLLEYNTVVWSPYLLGDIKKVERVQRNFTRRLLPDIEGYSARLIHLGLETLEARRIRFDLLEVFKITKGLSVIKFDEFFEQKRDDRTRGHPFQLRLRYVPRLEACRNFFANRVVHVWNNLPVSTVMSATLCQFKRELSSEFLKRHCKLDFSNSCSG